MPQVTHTLPEVPRVVPVLSGDIVLPYNLIQTPYTNEGLVKEVRELNHILSLLSDEEIPAIDRDEDCWLIHTENRAALERAWQQDYLCDVLTCISALHDFFAGEVCKDCVEELIDSNLDRDYSISLLSTGLHIVFDR